MEEKFFKKGNFSCLFTLLICFLLSSCAASSVSRSAATHVDTVVGDTTPVGIAEGDSSLSYDNYSQTSKGIIVGGAAGAAVGVLTAGSMGIFPGMAGGAVLGGIFGAYIDRHTTLKDQIDNMGGKVLVLGDQLMIVLPSAQLFKDHTAQLQPHAHETLDTVAQLIRGLTTISVRISGYTNATGVPEENCKLSQRQADAVLKYLFPIINTRVVTGVGYGGTHLIARNNPVWNEGANYRIEITLEKLPT